MPTFKAHRAIVAMCAAALALVAGGFVWALATLRAAGPGPFILHFNDITGITQVGTAGELAFAGVFAAVLVVVNFAVALELDARDRVLGKLLAAVTLLAAVLLFMACAAIMNVNG